MRRATRDIEFGRALRVGQDWLRCDETVWRVRQVRRPDCQAVLERAGERVSVTFAEMRSGWAAVVREREAA